MQHFDLLRSPSSPDGTFGVVYGPAGLVCRMLELPNRQNQCNLSCILTGDYQVIYLARSASGKYKDVYCIVNVPGRSGILIHAGNFAGDRKLGRRADSHGCPLPATRFGMLAGQHAGLASRGALVALHRATGKEDFMLHIRERSA